MSLPARCARALTLLVPLLVLLGVWLPELVHYYVPGGRPGRDIVAQARKTPPDAILRELEGMRIGPPTRHASERHLIAAADALLRGELRLPQSTAAAITLPFSKEDLARRGLTFGSLVVPEILLDAYARTGNDAYFAAARDFILEFARYERSAWVDRGFLWNDHAVAARVPILVQFWRIYRSRPDFDEEAGAAVLGLLARTGRLLAKPSHYTYRSNHGVMQNVGLLYLCIAFPQLPGASGWCDLAVGRLSNQFGFYVNAEGVVLEHSAGYHEFGMELMGIALRCLTLLERPAPREWVERYRKARDYYATLRRPDGTLPMYGDTENVVNAPLAADPDANGRVPALEPVRKTLPAAAFNLLPVSGHAVWWRGLQGWPLPDDLAQTVVTWSNFPDHAHQVADDLSVLLWSGGRTWITGRGYWPYPVPGRKQAEGWDGSNAPHLSGEPPRSRRTSRLVSYGDNGRLTLVDVRRDGPGAYAARRQVVQVDSRVWLVLDHVQGGGAQTSITTWTLHPDLSLALGPSGGAFRVNPKDKGPSMLAFFLGSRDLQVTPFRGSRQPHAGWVVIDQIPTPAPAFRIEHPAGDSWAMALWAVESADGAGTLAAPPRMMEWAGAERWKLDLPLRGGRIILEREGGKLTAGSPAAPDAMQVALTAGRDVNAERTAISSAVQAAKAQARPYRQLHAYRLKISYLLLALLAIQEVLRFALMRTLPRFRVPLDTGLAAGWIAIAAWVLLVYLPV